MIVERRLTATELAQGQLRLGAVEAQALRLPEFTGSISIRYQGRETQAMWDARRRLLTGEALLEDLSLEAQAEDRVRWTRDGQTLVLETHRPGANLSPRADSVSPFAVDPFDDPVLPSTSPAQALLQRRRRPAQRSQRQHVESDFVWPRTTIGVLKSSLDSVVSALTDGGWDTEAAFRLRTRGEELRTVNDFNELVAADSARIDPMDHQYAAARKALAVMRGRVILADEVGLGKTVEAGLICSELRVRGLADRILVITPAPLREQWQQELREKFSIEARVVMSGTQSLEEDSVIISRDLALRNRGRLQAQEWDIVIVDEAHKLAGPHATKTRETVAGLTARYMLFLTATPVQNELLELYRLVELLRPGTFTSKRQFIREYVDTRDGRQPRNAADLRRLVSNVMIRTTREQAGLDRVTRHVITHPVTMSLAEQDAYRLTVQMLREILTGPHDRFRRDSLARALTMSPRGLYESARAAAGSHPDPRAATILNDLADLAADQGPTARQQALVSLVEDWVTNPDMGRVIVFTQQTRVLNDLVRVLADQGIESAPYHGGMAAAAKNAALERFRSDVKVLVSTESGAEGLNLQHANAVINYDLPWNPMRIEQRIGRVHRVTQTRDVYVANMFASGTIDDHVHRILVDKLRMFELLFGQITTILGEIATDGDGADSFERQVKDALYARSDDEMARRLEELSHRAQEAHQSAQAQVSHAGGMAWMVPAMTHRNAIRRQASELQPKAARHRRKRQRAVEKFTRDWLNHHGCVIVHKTSDFIAAEVPERLQAELGGSTLYLAFSPQGLGEHPGAELVALGTPLFDDLVAATAEAGDLLGWCIDVPALHDQDAFPAIPAQTGLTPLSRRSAPLTVRGGRATWRVSDENTRFGDEVTTVAWGEPQIDPRVHKCIQPGSQKEWLRAFLAATPRAFTDGVMRETLDGLAAVRDGWQANLEASHQESTERRRSQLLEKLEATGAPREINRLEREINALHQESAPRVRIRAELLAVEVVSAVQVAVTEVWASPQGWQVEVGGVWDAASGVITLSGADGSPISTLDVCDDRHPTDASRAQRCPGCGSSSCPACPASRRPHYQCGVCDRRVCRTCLPVTRACPVCKRHPCADCWTGSTCSTCAASEDLPDHVVAATVPAVLHATGLRVRRGRDAHLTVLALAGAQRREVVLLDPDDRIRSWWTLTDVAASLLTRALTAAAAAGATGNLVITTDGQTCPPPPDTSTGMLLQRTTTQHTNWTIDGHDTPDPPNPGPTQPRPIRPTQTDLTTTLTAALPDPPDQPPVTATWRTRARDHLLWLDRDGLHSWTATGPHTDTTTAPWTTPDPDTTTALTHHTRDWTHHPHPTHTAALPDLTATLSTLGTYRLLHLLPTTPNTPLTTLDPGWHVRPGRTGVVPIPTRADHLLRLLPDDVTGTDAVTDLEFIQRTFDSPQLAWLSVVSERERAVPAGGQPPPPDITVLTGTRDLGPGAADRSPASTFRTSGGTVNLGRGLLPDLTALASPQATAVPEKLLAVEVVSAVQVAVTEVWASPQGWQVEVGGVWDAASGVITLSGADGSPISTLDVCDDRHPTDASRAQRCPGCGSSSCPACPASRRPHYQCGVCDRRVCRTCLPVTRACPVCKRHPCADCWTGSTCSTCAASEDLPDHVVAATVPAVLHATGLRVRRGRDAHLTVLALAGAQRREVVLLDPDDRIRSWWTLTDVAASLLTRALTAAAAAGATGNLVITTDGQTCPPPPDTSTGMLLQRTTTQHTNWTIDGHDTPDPPNPGPTQPRPIRPTQTDLTTTLTAALPDPPDQPPVTATWRTRARDHLLWLDRDGLHSWTATGPHTDTTTAPWTTPDPDTTTALTHHTRDWTHHPHPTHTAALPDLTATLSTLGTYRLLHLLPTTPNTPLTTLDLDGLGQDLEQLGLGLALTGQWVKCQVRSTVAGEKELSVVRTREGVARPTKAEWVVRKTLVDSAGNATPDLIVQTVAPGDLTPIIIQVGPLSNLGAEDRIGPNHAALEELVSASASSALVIADVGIRYEAAIMVGQDLKWFSYGVWRENLPQGVFDFSTGQHLARAEVCDSAHLSDSVSTCIYCRVRVCGACSVSGSPCSLCGVYLCARCATAGGRCRACSALRRLNRLQRRGYVASYPGCLSVLAGHDGVHEVVLIGLPGYVRRQVTMAGRLQIADMSWTIELRSLFGI